MVHNLGTHFARFPAEVVSPEHRAADVLRPHCHKCATVVEVGVPATGYSAGGLALHLAVEAHLALAQDLCRVALGKVETVAVLALACV